MDKAEAHPSRAPYRTPLNGQATSLVFKYIDRVEGLTVQTLQNLKEGGRDPLLKEMTQYSLPTH